MKTGVKETIGKTISGVVVTNNDNSPHIQLFLTFTDGTYFEIWGNDFSCAGRVDIGDMEKVVDYIKSSGAKITIKSFLG